ncbi:hypothetical protein DV515_00019580, partial [Chloebia gouldiae]
GWAEQGWEGFWFSCLSQELWEGRDAIPAPGAAAEVPHPGILGSCQVCGVGVSVLIQVLPGWLCPPAGQGEPLVCAAVGIGIGIGIGIRIGAGIGVRIRVRIGIRGQD